MTGLVNIDKSGAKKICVNKFNVDNNRRVKIRQCKYLNTIVEQDNRRIKRITRLMLGFKIFRTAQSTLAGIELVAKVKRGQKRSKEVKRGQIKKNMVGTLSPAEQFYALAA